MAFTKISLPAPAANGSGAAVDASSFGATKTITVKAGGSSVHKPSVIVEASNEAVPTKWAPLAFFAPDGEETIDVAVRWMRATVTNYREGSAPVVEVGGNDDGTEFASIPVPSGNGDGAGVDVDLPQFKSVHVAGAFRGSISILISQDGGATYQEAMTFLSGQSGIQSKVFAADYMKVRRDGVPEIDPGSPVVNVGACSIGGGGGGGGGITYDPITPPALPAGLTSNYAPEGVESASWIRQAVDSEGSKIGGLRPTEDGKVKLIENLGPSELGIVNEDEASDESWRFTTPGEVTLILPVGGVAVAVYDTTTERYFVSAISRLTPFLNVRDYGAKGDGVTDDREAITRAMNATATAAPNGGTLFFPPGEYLVSKTPGKFLCLELPVSNITLLGVPNQSWLLQPTGLPAQSTVLLMMINKSNVTIDGLGFNGNWGNAFTEIAEGSDRAVLPQAEIFVESTENFPNSGTFIINLPGQAGTETITYTGKTDASFTGCTGGTAQIFRGYAVGYENSNDGINQSTQADPKNHGIMIRGGENIKLNNCYFTQNYGDCIWIGTPEDDVLNFGRKVDIIGCTLNIAARNGITFGGAEEKVTIERCYIANVYTTAIDGEPQTINGHPRDVIIRDNEIRGWFIPAGGGSANVVISFAGGVPSGFNQTSAARAIRLLDNRIYGCTLIASAIDVVIKDNRIVMDGAGTFRSPIFVDHSADDITIEDNYIYDNAPLGTFASHIHDGAIQVQFYQGTTIAQPAGVRIKNNRIHARNGVHGIFIDGVGGFAYADSQPVQAPQSGNATAVTDTTLEDGGAAWTVNRFIGWTVLRGGATAVIESNTGTQLTLTSALSGSAWFDALGRPCSTPATGSYQIMNTSGVLDIDGNDIDLGYDGNTAGGNGIYLFNDRAGGRIRVHNNKIKNPGPSASGGGGRWGIYVVGDTTKPVLFLQITENKFWDDHPTPTMAAGIRFSAAASLTSITKLVMAGNSMVGGVTTLLSNVSSGVWLLADGTTQQWMGYGTPESVVTAPAGSTYTRVDSTPPLVYVKTGTGSTGWTQLQASLGQKNIIRIWPNAGSSTVSTSGLGTVVLSGAAARAVATTSLLAGTRRVGFTSPAGAANRCGFYTSSAPFWRGNVAGAGGFRCLWRFAPSDAVLNSGARMFVGLSASVEIFTDTDPSGLTNLVGIGQDAGDATLQLIASGAVAQAKTDLGANFPITAGSDIYELELFAPPNGAYIDYVVRRLNTSNVASGRISAAANLPSSTTLLGPRGYRTTGAVADAVSLDLLSFYAESEL